MTNFDFLTKSLNYRQDNLLFISYLLLKYNLRCSEILAVKKSDLHYPYFIVFPGKKRSANVIIRDDFVLNYFKKLVPVTKDKFFDTVNYHSIYNYFKRNFSHLFVQYRNRKNFKITHGPRYYFAQMSDNPEIVRDLLHHRSVKSGVFYNNKIRSHKNGSN